MKIKKFRFNNLSLKKKLFYKRDLHGWRLIIDLLVKEKLIKTTEL